MPKLDKHFVSEADQKIREFDQTQPLSSTQKAEMEKYKKIHEKRDNPSAK